MRVATWNVNGLRARLDFVKLWLAERQPDVVLLQELKLPDEAFPAEDVAEAGYHAVVAGQKAWNGVAVLSRDEASLVQRGLPGQDELGSRLVTASIGDLTVTSVYVPNGKSVDHDDFPRKLRWLGDLAGHFAKSLPLDGDVLVGGDFNVCPAPIDSWSEEKLAGTIFHTDDERARFQELLDLGLVDVFREEKPEEKAFSWWDYRAGAFPRGHGLRIDFLLGSESVAKRVKSVEIDRDWRKKHDGLTPSDHAPVVVDLE